MTKRGGRTEKKATARGTGGKGNFFGKRGEKETEGGKGKNSRKEVSRGGEMGRDQMDQPPVGEPKGKRTKKKNRGRKGG